METGSSGTQSGDPVVNRPVPADWLALRRAADHRARAKTAGLLEDLRGFLSSATEAPVQVVDVGAGTGSNQAWLAPRLGVPQSWILLDHDAGLIGVAEELSSEEPAVSTQRVVGTVEDVPGILHSAAVSKQHLETDSHRSLVTCAALLDLLTPDEAKILADSVTGGTAAGSTAALLSLSVTGTVRISPDDTDDAAIAHAFDAHQRREGLLGPDAVEAAVALFRQRGMVVTVQETDWELTSADGDLLRRYLSDRAAVAVEHEPALASTVQEWLERRLSQVELGLLTVRVGHADVMALPAPPGQ